MNWYEKIVGREYEKKLLESYYSSDKLELVALYGRRRVGKTYLIKCTFQDTFDFYFSGIYEGSKNLQIKEFSKPLTDNTPSDWFEAFNI